MGSHRPFVSRRRVLACLLFLASLQPLGSFTITLGLLQGLRSGQCRGCDRKATDYGCVHHALKYISAKSSSHGSDWENDWEVRGLDWGALWDRTAGMARSQAGQRFVRYSTPLPSVKAVKMWHDAVQELHQVTGQPLSLNLAHIDDVRDEVQRASMGGLLTVQELWRVAQTVRGLVQLRREVTKDVFSEACPTIRLMWGRADVSAALSLALGQAFDDKGNLSELAYPALKSLRARLEQVMSNKKRDSEQILDGLTALLEEEQRIAVSLSKSVAPHADSIVAGVCAAARVDGVLAREQLARYTHSVRPLVRSEGNVTLVAARHPVLEIRRCQTVPNDVSLQGNEGVCVVVSGPNAGGKTVYLKTIALAALLVAHGCWVPCAKGSRVDLLKSVSACVGDEQSILLDNSTFSSHVHRLSGALSRSKQYGSACLVVVDELCAGTDPCQGAALGQAFLEEVVRSGARVVVTTHFAQLSALGMSGKPFAAAAVGLVNDEIADFTVLHGAVGQSDAFAAARRQGFPQSILDRATHILGDHVHILNALKASEHARRARDKVTKEELQLAIHNSEVRIREMRGEIWSGARRLEKEAFKRTHKKVMDAFGEVEIVSQLALKREVSVYERDMEEDGSECWGQFYTGAVQD